LCPADDGYAAPTDSRRSVGERAQCRCTDRPASIFCDSSIFALSFGQFPCFNLTQLGLHSFQATVELFLSCANGLLLTISIKVFIKVK
jgi:hypothetical protein